MKNLTTLRDTGSLIAGLLVGLSIAVAVFSMTLADSGTGQAASLVAAAIVLAVGLALQTVLTKRRPGAHQ